MEAETEQSSKLEAKFQWTSPLSRQTNPVRAVLIGVAVWLVWRFWL
jgi:hypothetical protein